MKISKKIFILLELVAASTFAHPSLMILTEIRASAALRSLSAQVGNCASLAHGHVMEKLTARIRVMRWGVRQIRSTRVARKSSDADLVNAYLLTGNVTENLTAQTS